MTALAILKSARPDATTDLTFGNEQYAADPDALSERSMVSLAVGPHRWRRDDYVCVTPR